MESCQEILFEFNFCELTTVQFCSTCGMVLPSFVTWSKNVPIHVFQISFKTGIWLPNLTKEIL